MAEDELSVLAEIFCLPGELTQWCDGKKICVKVIISERCPHVESHEVTLVFSLSEDYPSESCPQIEVSSYSIKCDDIQDKLQTHAHNNVGSPLVLDLINYAKELIQDLHSSNIFDCTQLATHRENSVTDTQSSSPLPPLPSSSHTKNLKVKSPTSQNIGSQTEIKDVQNWTLLIHIDHMRAKAKYIKFIKKWCRNFQLSGQLIFFKKIILLFLVGEHNNLKSYLVQHKTVCVDVDSRGVGCKEKMMTVLYEGPCLKDSLNITPSGLQIQECSSLDEVKDIFTNASSQHLFVNYVSKLKSIHH
ncbi:RWD domain-containing protein 3 isoform X2 [Octopus bimaculoides]|uniref:RWD domain-containing protein 3 n=1 Tax=Octopus bimaculoides TaxID=37653 RepID=A0A0L8FPK7_OCTBM|nr:RWD domain-containing protein 3 isoform X2 [Octopus bimaculoides]|eukprot:XP_014788000.1 PREDICTED: RWD domain-containing protein 3-like [Octopus bimaculoides]